MACSHRRGRQQQRPFVRGQLINGGPTVLLVACVVPWDVFRHDSCSDLPETSFSMAVVNIRREPLRRINRKGGEKGLSSSCKKKKFVSYLLFLKIREVLEKGIEIGLKESWKIFKIKFNLPAVLGITFFFFFFFLFF